MVEEINFDGLVGPSHNYAALSRGNLASQRSGGGDSRPRAAALQGLAKMRRVMGLGLVQGLLLPHERPAVGWLRQLGFSGPDEAVCAAAWEADPALFAQAVSASPMWTANAATVSPAADTVDGRVHLTVANLSAMPHRSHEQEATARQLRRAFADPGFVVHDALPAVFGDEGAANHMRLAEGHGTAGVEIFVHGAPGGRFPARQARQAGAAVARRHGVRRALFVEQARAAIEAGAFHNDVVAVANGRVLLAHEQAFADRDGLAAALGREMPDAVLLWVGADEVPLADAIASYLFNSQLLSLKHGGMALVVPAECGEVESVRRWLDRLPGRGTPIGQVIKVDVRESMKNGGGPACLRLRVVCVPARVDARFLLDERKADMLEQLVETHWPVRIAASDLGNPALWAEVKAARAALLAGLGFAEGEL